MANIYPLTAEMFWGLPSGSEPVLVLSGRRVDGSSLHPVSLSIHPALICRKALTLLVTASAPQISVTRGSDSHWSLTEQSKHVWPNAQFLHNFSRYVYVLLQSLVKSSWESRDQPTIIPQGVPYMVKLLRYYVSEDAVYLHLEHVKGELLTSKCSVLSAAEIMLSGF